MGFSSHRPFHFHWRMRTKRTGPRLQPSSLSPPPNQNLNYQRKMMMRTTRKRTMMKNRSCCYSFSDRASQAPPCPAARSAASQADSAGRGCARRYWTPAGQSASLSVIPWAPLPSQQGIWSPIGQRLVPWPETWVLIGWKERQVPGELSARMKKRAKGIPFSPFLRRLLAACLPFPACSPSQPPPPSLCQSHPSSAPPPLPRRSQKTKRTMN